MKKPQKAPKPYTALRFGILNPYGDVWSPSTFETAAEADLYLRRFWSGVKDHDNSEFKIVPVTVVVSAVT